MRPPARARSHRKPVGPVNLRGVTAAMLVLAVTLTACTTERTSSPNTRLPTDSTTSTISTTSTTSSTIAPTSSTSTSSTSTTSTTTTTAAPPTPTTGFVPLLAGGGEGGWLFLGAWSGDRWDDPVDPSGSPVVPGIEAGIAFTLSNLDGETPGRVGANVEACQDGRVGPTMDVVLAPPDPPGYGFSAVALPARTWPAKPRPVAVVPNNVAAYAALGAAAFDGTGVDGSLGNVEQTVVVDLDGDGSEEVLVAYEYVQPSIRGTTGDLAALLLVDAITRASTSLVSSFVGPNVSEPLFERYRVLDVTDLNGDGRMEVVVHAWRFEGAEVQVYEYVGSELVEVTSTGCGS